MQTTYLNDCINQGRLSRWSDNVMPLKVFIGKYNWYQSNGANDELPIEMRPMWAFAYALLVEPMSPRLTSPMTMSPFSLQ